MTFIQTDEGPWVNLDHVQTISPRREDGKTVYRLEGKEGELFGETSDCLLLGPIVAAQPGFTLLSYYGPDDGDTPETEEIFTQPIVAWHIEHAYAKPITLSEDTLRSDWVIESPDGRVHGLAYVGGEWESRDAWLVHARAEHASQIKRMAV